MSDHWEKDSELHSLSFNSGAESELGSALEPEIPALVTRVGLEVGVGISEWMKGY